MPITMASLGDAVVIRRVTGLDAIRQRLTELGFVENAFVTIVSKNNGNLILKVKESRIALSYNLARRILI